MLDMKHRIFGELVDPWPVLWIWNLMQFLYDVSDIFIDIFNLNLASSNVLAWTKTMSL